MTTNIFDKEQMLKKMEETKKQKFLPFDLQFFADDPPGDPAGGGNDDPPAKVELTQDELDKKIEAEADRKLASALKKKEDEWKVQTQQQIDAAIAEKERLSKLSEKERKDEELNQREKDIANRLAELERKELKADAIADLNKKELPSSFADFLLADNAENTLKNINTFKEAFDAAVNEAVKEKLRQDTPPAGGGGAGKGTNSIAALRNKQDQQQNKAPDPWA